jgi:phosphonate transport system permease protein
MTIAVSILTDQQLAALNEVYRKAVARKAAARHARRRGILCRAGDRLGRRRSEPAHAVHLFRPFRQLFRSHLLTWTDGSRVWTNIPEWLWGWKKWSLLLGETILISYVGTLFGAVLGFALNFLAAENTSPGPGCAFIVKRLMEFCRTVPDIVFALIFVIAFGLGPMAGVLAITIHSIGALGKQYAEMVENIDMKPVEGLRSTGASWIACMRFAVLPQVAAGFASYTLLRFEINVRSASVMGFVGAGGIGVELITAIRKFYYSDVSAILLMIILTVFVIDIGTGWIRGRLFGKERRA